MNAYCYLRRFDKITICVLSNNAYIICMVKFFRYNVRGGMMVVIITMTMVIMMIMMIMIIIILIIIHFMEMSLLNIRINKWYYINLMTCGKGVISIERKVVEYYRLVSYKSVFPVL